MGYARTLYIRKGWADVQMGTLAEDTQPGRVINLADMTEYDADDTDLGIVINDIEFSIALAGTIASGSQVYFITLANARAAAAEIYMYEQNVGAITKGAKVYVTTDGEIIEWAYGDNTEETDTLRDVLGTSIDGHSQNGGGWVRFGG